MKFPDKIYIREASASELALPRKDYHLEYIRKGLLWEWAKRELEMRRNTGDDYFYPAIVVLGDLIDKLNSL